MDLMKEFPELFERLDNCEGGLVYWPKYREIGIRVLDGGSAISTIDYCPWTGKKLPSSVRDQWFDIVWGLGLEPGDTGVPEEMNSDAWWQARGL